MRQRTPTVFRPQVERFENRSLLSGGLGVIEPAGPRQHATVVHAAQHTVVHAAQHKVAVQVSREQRHEPRRDNDHDYDDNHRGLGGGHGPGGTFFDCAARGIYNFAIVTITNVSTSLVKFSVLAKPCPDTFVPERLLPGGTMWFYTHFPSTLPPSFQVNLGGLNSYTPKPNIVSSKLYPQFVYQITPAMGSQYQIVQTSPGVFALRPAS
jgi:hypothetical protein